MEHILLFKIIQSKLQSNHGAHIDLWGVDTTKTCPDMIDLWDPSRGLNVHYVFAVVSIEVTGAVRTWPLT